LLVRTHTVQKIKIVSPSADPKWADHDPQDATCVKIIEMTGKKLAKHRRIRS